MNDYLTGRLSEQLANEQTDQLTDDWHAPATGSADRQLTDGLTCPSYWLSWQTSWQMAWHGLVTGSADRWLDMVQLLAQLTVGLTWSSYWLSWHMAWHGPATGSADRWMTWPSYWLSRTADRSVWHKANSWELSWLPWLRHSQHSSWSNSLTH